MKDVTYLALIRKKPVKDFLVSKIGEEGLVLVEILFKAKKFVSEFTLAERSAIYVNTVRSLMYKLYDNKIVNYNRKREKTRGWYIYSWKLNPIKLLSVVIKKLRTEKKELKNSLESQTEDKYFYCKKCDIKLQFTEAMEYNFSCPNCFEQMKLTSPSKENKQTKKKMESLDKKIDSLKDIKKRLILMKEKKEEAERKKQEKEKAEKKALAEKGLYYCIKCKRTHKIKSQIGDKHKEHAK